MIEEKIKLSERNILTKYIISSIIKSFLEKKFFKEVSFIDAKVIVRGSLLIRGNYILYNKNNLPIAVLELKENNFRIYCGIQETLTYSESFQILFTFSSNFILLLEIFK